jgi:hypothetical protein
MIHATCHTADNVVCLEFDATPWFSEADALRIIDLAKHEWSSAAVAESLERRQGYERLHDLIEYAAERLQPESLEDLSWNTFECIVDGPDAMAWLEKNRPDVLARIRSQTRYQPSENSRYSISAVRKLPLARGGARWERGRRRNRVVLESQGNGTWWSPSRQRAARTQEADQER